MKVIFILAVGVAMSVAFPSEMQERLTKRQDTDREPNCPADNTYVISGFTSGDPKFSKAKCDCSYVGDKAGQVGTNSNLAWYQGQQCGNASFAYVVLTQDTRKAWEIRCQCYPLEETETDCIVSDFEGQWTRCFVVVAPEAPDTYCSEIHYSDGSVEKGLATCNIAGDYYWGRK